MSETSRLDNPLEVFFSYAHEDEALRDKLAKHLSALKRQQLTMSWHDRQISPGKEWAGQLDEHLNSAHLILLLISPDFVASDYCYNVEAQRALERHDAGETRVIPIILRPTDWMRTPFARLQALPKNAKPITTWSNQDQAFLNVVKDIGRVVEELSENITTDSPSFERIYQNDPLVSSELTQGPSSPPVLRQIRLPKTDKADDAESEYHRSSTLDDRRLGGRLQHYKDSSTNITGWERYIDFEGNEVIARKHLTTAFEEDEAFYMIAQTSDLDPRPIIRRKDALSLAELADLVYNFFQGLYTIFLIQPTIRQSTLRGVQIRTMVVNDLFLKLDSILYPRHLEGIITKIRISTDRLHSNLESMARYDDHLLSARIRSNSYRNGIDKLIRLTDEAIKLTIDMRSNIRSLIYYIPINTGEIIDNVVREDNYINPEEDKLNKNDFNNIANSLMQISDLFLEWSSRLNMTAVSLELSETEKLSHNIDDAFKYIRYIAEQIEQYNENNLHWIELLNGINYAKEECWSKKHNSSLAAYRERLNVKQHRGRSFSTKNKTDERTRFELAEGMEVFAKALEKAVSRATKSCPSW